jgi:hypothetical protein
LGTDGDVVGGADHAERGEGFLTVLTDQLLDVRGRLGRVVLVVHVLELERERAVADLHATLGVDLLEVGLPAASDLGERRGQPGLRVARGERDDVAIDLLGGIGGAVLGVDRRLSRRLAVATGLGLGAVVVVTRAAGGTHHGQREQHR